MLLDKCNISNYSNICNNLLRFGCSSRSSIDHTNTTTCIDGGGCCRWFTHATGGLAAAVGRKRHKRIHWMDATWLLQMQVQTAWLFQPVETIPPTPQTNMLAVAAGDCCSRWVSNFGRHMLELQAVSEKPSRRMHTFAMAKQLGKSMQLAEAIEQYMVDYRTAARTALGVNV